MRSKIVLVTGAASGIGATTSALFTSLGATVHRADRVLTGDERLDVTVEQEWERVIGLILTRHGRLDVLVHAAGISAGSPLQETTLDEWRRVLTVNLDGAFLATKHGIRAMHAAGISAGSPLQETTLDEWRRVLTVNLDGAFLATKHGIRAMHATGGAIVLVGSASGTRPAAGAAAYSTSKAGLAMLMRTAAKECRERDPLIRVNAVSPAGVKTPLWGSMPFFQELVQQTGSEEGAYAAMERQGGGKFLAPEEVAHAIRFLASDEAAHITGVDLPVDAGYIL